MSVRCPVHHQDSALCGRDEAIADALDTLRDLDITPIPAVLDDLALCDPCDDHDGMDPEQAVVRLVRLRHDSRGRIVGMGHALEDAGPLHLHAALRSWRRYGPVGVLVPACAVALPERVSA